MKRIAIAGITGLVTISLYLIVTLQFGFHTATAMTLFQWDASNALGMAAFRGGWESALLGLLMDAVVAIAWAAVFVLLVRRIAAARKYTIASGLLFGAIVMIVMHWVVVPLGHAPRAGGSPIALLNELIAHSIFFGLPVATSSQRS